MVHGDVTLENILWEDAPPTADVKLIDFGRCRFLHETQSTKIRQELAPPETMDQHPGMAADQLVHPLQSRQRIQRQLPLPSEQRVELLLDSFTLGRRASDVLEAATARPILAHVAMSEGKKYPYEMLFRSIMLHLMDAVTNEHIFCRQFFKRDAFVPLFHSTLGLLLEQLENYLFGCHDAISLLLMIKITHAHRRILHTRLILSLDGFLDQVNNLIWPRLKAVMDAHLRSIKSANAKKLGGVDLHAHYVSRRYAEFTCSILMVLHRSDKVEPAAAAKIAVADAAVASAKVISSKANTSLARDSAGDMLLNDLAVIQEETIVLLERMGDEHPSNKRRIVFLINNLDQIVCIFQERRVVGKEFNRFAEALMTQRELFVEEELLQNFSKLIAFVQQTEQHLATGGNHKEVNAQVVEALIR
jgi:vacuolar protein sorting-associated protein 52